MINKYVIAAISTALLAVGALTSGKLVSLHYENKLASVNLERAREQKQWAESLRAAEQRRADEIERLMTQQRAAEVAASEVDRELQESLAKLRRGNADLNQRLRVALRKTCPAVIAASVSGTATATGIDHGTADGDRLRDRIAEGLERRIVDPADRQTSALIACQSYIRTVCLRDR